MTFGNRAITVQEELFFSKTAPLRALGEGVGATEKSPFSRSKLQEGKARVKAKLSAVEVARPKALPVGGTGAGRLLAHDTWLLQYYVLGSPPPGAPTGFVL